MTKIIGLTGPIGAGKDSVAKILADQGAIIIDADAIGHQLLENESPVSRQITKAFGSTIKQRDGSVNRKKLGKIVFSDPEKLSKLNQLTHPAIFEKISAQTAFDKEGGRKLSVINAALLFEIGLDLLCDQIWLVEAPAKLRLARLMKKGLSKKDALLRIAIQGNFENFVPQVDQLIVNDGTKAALKRQVLRLKP